jgi:TolB protein
LARISAELAGGWPWLAFSVALLAPFGCGSPPSLIPDATPIPFSANPQEQIGSIPEQDFDTGALSSLAVDRIAYIGPYGDLFTVNPDGSDERRLTGVSRVRSRPSDPAGPASPSDTAAFYSVQNLDFNDSYAWPTWSPDGTRLAVSRVQVAPNRTLEVSVQVIDAVTGISRVVYENDVPGLIADGSPHYLYWSPDGELLSFLATTRQGLTLFAVNPDTSEGAIALERGAPLYFSWSGNGQALIVHSRDEVKLLRRPLLVDSPQYLASAVGFRTPALSTDGESWAWSAGETAASSLYVGGSGRNTALQILDTGPLVAFMWSPDGRTLAVADNPDPQGRIYQRLRLVSTDGSGRSTLSRSTLVEEPLLAFYWSPDSARIAWVGVDAEEQVFEMMVSPVAEVGSPAADRTPEARGLFRFRPSGEVFTMFSFFDQYAYSHSPWSPDSTRLVVAGSEGPVTERRNGHSPTGARVYVLDAVGDAPPTEIAQGSVAFWSWN